LKRDAVLWAKRVEADHDLMEAMGTRGAGMRFAELVDEYTGQWTGKCINQIIRAAYWKEHFSNYRLIDITADMIRQQLKTLELGHGKRGDGAKGKTKMLAKTRAPATINRYRTVLSAIFNYAIGEGYLTVNPVNRVPCRKVNNQRTRYLNDNERQGLLVVCKTSEWNKPCLSG
jgi:integrase